MKFSWAQVQAIESNAGEVVFLHFWISSNEFCIYLGTLSEKKTILFGNFSQHGGGGLPKSQNFCKFTKYFFVCQIGPKMAPNGQKHVILII